MIYFQEKYACQDRLLLPHSTQLNINLDCFSMPISNVHVCARNKALDGRLPVPHLHRSGNYFGFC